MNQIVQKVIQIRINKLQESLDQAQLFKIEEENQIFKEINLYIEKIQNQKDENFQRFFSYLLIQYTRIFEAFSLDHNGNKRFMKQTDKNFQTAACFEYPMFFQFTYSIKSLFDDDSLSIKRFDDVTIINQVIENLKKNIQVVEIIMMQPVSFDDIDNYFKQVQIFLFDGLIQFYTQGLASFDGKYLFINEFYSKPRNIYKLLESAAMDNFYFWLIKSTNPFLILPEINELLIDSHDIRIEASDFYSIHAHEVYIHLPCPFRMITVNYKPLL